MDYAYAARGRIRTLRRLGKNTTRSYYWDIYEKKWVPKAIRSIIIRVLRKEPTAYVNSRVMSKGTITLSKYSPNVAIRS